VSDTAYIDAVRRGDLSTAQRLVDAAAKKVGFTSGPWYHGTMGRFNRFNENQISHTGFHFGDERTANKFAGDEGDLISVYLNIQNPLRLPDLGEWSGDDFLATFRRIFKNTSEPITKDEAETLRDVDSPSNGDILDIIYKRGYDGIVYSNSAEGDGGDSMMVLDSFQIKSADPVTYDDAGNVIPLSERFSDQSDDIRNPRTAPKQFPYEYAAYLKAHFPAIWAAGGNIRGNDTFRWWTAYRKGDRSPTVMHWWNVTRPAWIARHYRDYRLPGVIAQIKWGTVGTLGVAGMKRVVEDAIRKRYA
jgi:hypothetical protein